LEEQVLVVPEAVAFAAGAWQGLTTDLTNRLPTILDPRHLTYKPRSQAEDDPSVKQLIPYAVLRVGDRVYSYRRGRKGGETRLHDLWSIGVGGHICQEDGAAGDAAYRAGFLRELQEEVEIAGPWRDEIVGLVYDPRTPVGSVHLGVIHLVQLTRAEVHPRDAALTDAGFAPIADWRRRLDELETWSQFALELLPS
jgi:predicted NUDIX family phosphoesterase